MKKLLFLFLMVPLVSVAQTAFHFEDVKVPVEWTTQNGTLSLTKDHFKEGEQSLCWEGKNRGELIVKVSDQSYVGKTAFMQIRSAEATNDTIVVDFINASGRVVRVANVLVNFAGWNEFNRLYSETHSISAPKIAKVRFTLKATDKNATRRIWFDAVDFYRTDLTKMNGPIFELDQPLLNGFMLEFHSHKVDIPATKPTAEELAGLALLRSRFLPRPVGPTAGVGLSLTAARTFADSYNIVRNPDGSVKGKVMDLTATKFTTAFFRNVLGALEGLAPSYVNSKVSTTSANSADSLRFMNLLDHALDQGVSQGLPFSMSTSAYNDCRQIPAAILNIAYLVTGQRRAELLKLNRWVSLYGFIYMPNDFYASNLNTDIIHNFLPHYYGYAVLQEDDAIAVRELKALKRNLERIAEITPGSVDGIKTDGCGFHHATHYNNYMYAYNAWGQYIYNLRQTPFNVDKDGYLGFAHAVKAMLLQSTRSLSENNGTLIYANSLCGRNPYNRGGIHQQVPFSMLKELVEVSTEILDKQDAELGAIYNFFTQTKTFKGVDKNYDGYYQYNYSPIGLARKNNWVVTMRCPTSHFWGAEIYINQNRFGRYQSHGSMEVTYSGTKAQSGIPVNDGSGGWDWNMVPGTTTVHYTSWKDMNPGGVNNQRFDQKSTKNFAGALSFGANGVFVADFIQNDSWGSQVLEPTNLKFKKSVFTFDNLFVALGTNISSVRSKLTELTTATNLFQEIKSDFFKKFIVNGEIVTDGTSKICKGTQNNWFLTPLGTGYYVPKNNNDIVVKFAEQISPVETGADIDNPRNRQVAAKAYIDHGTQPKAAQYHFAMVPATNQEEMAALATKIGDNGGGVYRIESQTDQLHAITHYDSHTTSYAFFTAVDGLTFGDVISTTTEHLLMVKSVPGSNLLEIAVTNPNLRPKDDETYRFLAQPTETTITLKGKWTLKSQTAGVKSATIVGDNTELSIKMSEGMPEYITLMNESASSTSFVTDQVWVTLNDNSDNMTLHFAPRVVGNKQIRIFSPDGSLAHQVFSNDEICNINKSVLRPGVYLVQVIAAGESKTFKVVIR